MHKIGPPMAVMIFVVVVGAYALINMTRGGSAQTPSVMASVASNAPKGTIVVLGREYGERHLKLVNPPTQSGIRLIAWCRGGPIETRSFATDADVDSIERLVLPDDGFYREALADCGNELGN